MNWKASIVIILLLIGTVYMYFFADLELTKVVFWLFVSAIGIFVIYKMLTALFKPS
jgi:hypothetical protein